jgi:hypothetical protein
VRGRLHQSSLDPELAQSQPLVGLEFDRRPGQQVVVAAAGVVEQVAGQLLLEGALVALQLHPVLLGEVDGVLVRHVDPRHPGRLVGVHLLGQLASELDRLNLGAEGTAEHPLDQAFDATLEVA